MFPMPTTPHGPRRPVRSGWPWARPVRTAATASPSRVYVWTIGQHELHRVSARLFRNRRGLTAWSALDRRLVYSWACDSWREHPWEARMTEQLANLSYSTLQASITAGATSLVVASA